jgi:hypothetical protein
MHCLIRILFPGGYPSEEICSLIGKFFSETGAISNRGALARQADRHAPEEVFSIDMSPVSE